MIYNNFATMLPIQKNTKIPIRQWKQDGQVVDFKQSDFVNCDVGLCPLPGYIAIDVDTKDGKDGLSSLDLLGLSVGETLTQTTPSGGYHLIYKINKNIELKSAVSTLDGIDLRTSNQGYIKLYNEWLDYEDDEITTDAIIELPSSAIKMLLDAQKETKTRVKNTIHAGDLITSDRNSTLTSIAGKLWSDDIYITVDELSDKVHSINSKRCTPSLPAIEVENIVNSISKYDKREIIDSSLADGVINKLISDYFQKIEENELENKMVKFPKSLFKVNGLLKDLISAIDSSSQYLTPHLSLASAITLIGTIAGDKFRTPEDGKTNIYTVGLGMAGAGKNHARTFIKKILLSHEKGKEILGGDKVTSGKAIKKSLSKNNQKLYFFDEFGYMLKSISGEKAQAHEKDIMTTLLVMYSEEVYGGDDAASDDNCVGVIENPILGVYATSTPSTYYECITDKSITSGELPRFLVVDDPSAFKIDNDNRTNYNEHKSVVDKVHSLIDHTKHIRSDHISTYLDTMTTVPYADMSAKEAIIKFKKYINSTYTDEITCGLWSRAVENALKLATVYAISDNFENPKVTLDAVKWGIDFVKYCAEVIASRLDDSADTKHSRDRKTVITFLMLKKDKKSDRSSLLRKTGLKSKEFDELISDMIETRDLIHTVDKLKLTSKNYTNFYQLRKK